MYLALSLIARTLGWELEPGPLESSPGSFRLTRTTFWDLDA